MSVAAARRQESSAGHGAAVEIGQAKAADAADLLRLIRAYYRFDQIRFERRSVAAALEKLRRSANGRVWILRDGRKAIGSLVLTYNFDLEFGGLEGLVTALFVEQKYRGKGLDKRALEVAGAHCRSRGIGTIELQVGGGESGGAGVLSENRI